MMGCCTPHHAHRAHRTLCWYGMPLLHHLHLAKLQAVRGCPPAIAGHAVCQERVCNALALMRPSGRWLADLQPPPLLRMKGGDTKAGWSNSYRWLPLWERLDLDVLFQAMKKSPWWGKVRAKGGLVGGPRLASRHSHA